jgi:hypothetical protein
MAGLYIKIFHDKEDDPAGFLAMCIVTTFVSLIVANTIAVFIKILQNGMDIKSENELLYKESKK